MPWGKGFFQIGSMGIGFLSRKPLIISERKSRSVLSFLKKFKAFFDQ
jgi:hypothetical protein